MITLVRYLIVMVGFVLAIERFFVGFWDLFTQSSHSGPSLDMLNFGTPAAITISATILLMIQVSRGHFAMLQSISNRILRSTLLVLVTSGLTYAIVFQSTFIIAYVHKVGVLEVLDRQYASLFCCVCTAVVLFIAVRALTKRIQNSSNAAGTLSHE